MVKIVAIKEISSHTITCMFNDGAIKKVDVKPLLQKHHYLKGIDNLYNEDVFKKAKIGEMGEILWEEVITIEDNNQPVKWNYDISPEFAYYNGELVK